MAGPGALLRRAHETLIRLDCRGQVHPDLALAWTTDTTGVSWTFTLRDLPQLPAASAASLLVSYWEGQAAYLEAVGIRSARAPGGGQVVVTMATPHDSVPPIFADAELALPGEAQRSPSSFSPEADLRDALDRGVDLAVTRDPAVVEYAASRPEFDIFPLPWSTTYVLLQPPGAPPLEGVIGSDSVRESLAHDAVRAEARAAEPPFWWDRLPGCAPRPDPGPSRISARVVYPGEDPVARGLATRMVALAPSGAGLTAAGLSRAELAAALRNGSQQAFIIPLPRQTLAPCHEGGAWPRGSSLLPLIDTRARAILRRGAAGLSVDWDGTVRILAP